MRIQKIDDYNNSFTADLSIIGETKGVLTKEDLKTIKSKVRRYELVKSITVKIGQLDPKNGKRETSIDVFVNGLTIPGPRCYALHDVEVRKFLVEHFKDLNKPTK